jgi:hypothetical protein
LELESRLYRLERIDIGGEKLTKGDNWRLCGRWIEVAQMAGNSNMAFGESHSNDCRDNWVIKSLSAQDSKSQFVSGSIPH